MQSTLRRSVVPTLLAAAVLGGAACSNSSTTTTTPGGSTPSGTASGNNYSSLSGTLQGSGSTFQAAFNEEAIDQLSGVAPNLKINYGGGGSGKGKTDLQGQLVDFAGTDSLVKDNERAAYKGGTFLYVPTVASPITVSYNLSGLDKLQLSAATLADIFEGDIKKWNDPAIAADNSGATLPDADIKVVRRADSSGTSDTFTKYLKAAVPDFKIEPGSTPTWPADFVAQQGNSGVAKAIQDTTGSVGYVDLADATDAKLKLASIKNKAGTFVAPSLEASVGALAAAEVKDDLTFNALNTAGADAYPIVASTYIMVYEKQTDAKKAEALKGFLTYLLTEGQDLAKSVNYAKLPDSLRQKAIAQVAKIKA